MSEAAAGEAVEICEDWSVEPGAARRVLVQGRALAVFNVAGEFHVTDDTCTHEEASLSEGWIDDGVIEFDIAFSPDERFMYVADGMNERVHVVDRESLAVRTSFGIGGRQPSGFRELGNIVVDEEGNIYTGEDGQGRRIHGSSAPVGQVMATALPCST